MIDDPGCFAIADRYWLRHGSVESASNKAMIKFGILVVLHPNPGIHTRFSDGAGKFKKRDPIEQPIYNARRSFLEG